jgi:hypothetical protein
MGKLHFEWKEGQLIISQCDKIKTDPNQCNECKHRFQCFTERPKPSSARLNTGQIPELSKLLKEIEIAFDVDDKP